MRGGRSVMSSHHAPHNGGGNGNGMVNQNTRSRSRSRSLGRRKGSGSGQSSLSAHIQQQMERPRRGERDPTPLSRPRPNAPESNHNYNGSPQRRGAASSPRRAGNNNNKMNLMNVESSSISSCEERAAIAANLAKTSFSAHRNLQMLIDEQRDREYRVEHGQHNNMQMHVYNPSQPSSVAAVHQEPHYQTPLKLMVGHEGFFRDSAESAMTSGFPTTPSTMGSNAALSPELGHDDNLQIQRVASAAGHNSNNGHYTRQQQHQQQQFHQRRQRLRSVSPRRHRQRSVSPMKQHREPLTNYDEEQLNSIVKDHPDPELAKSIAKIMAFQKRSTTPCARRPSLNKTPSRDGKTQSFHSNSTAPTAASSLNSSSLFVSTSNSSSPKSPQSQSQQRPNASIPRYLDKETIYNHLQDAPRESRVQLTRVIESLQSENKRLNEVNLDQVNQIDKLESEVGDLLRELLRYRREFGELDSIVAVGGSEGDVSSEFATAPTNSTTMSPYRRVSSSSGDELRKHQESNVDDQQLDVVRPYVKSKSLHDESRDRGLARLRNSSASAPAVSRLSSGHSHVSFESDINDLKRLQIAPSSSDEDDAVHRVSTTDSQTTGTSFYTAEESIFDPSVNTKQRSFKEQKHDDATSLRRSDDVIQEHDDDDDPQSDSEDSIDEEQLIMMQQQQEHEDSQKDEDRRETMMKSNSLEDIFEPENRRRCFVEQKGSSTTSSVPSATDTICSWSCSTESGGKER